MRGGKKHSLRSRKRREVGNLVDIMEMKREKAVKESKDFGKLEWVTNWEGEYFSIKREVRKRRKVKERKKCWMKSWK